MDVYTYREYLRYQGFQVAIRMCNGVGLVHNARFIPVLAKLRKLLFACNLQIGMINAPYQRVDAAEQVRLRRTAVYD